MICMKIKFTTDLCQLFFSKLSFCREVLGISMAICDVDLPFSKFHCFHHGAQRSPTVFVQPEQFEISLVRIATPN